MQPSIHDISVWTALITPMLDNGDIDFNSLTVCVRKQESAGNGILIVGSTGEGLALTTQEQQAVVKHVTSLQLSVPIMAGVGGYQLQSQLEWLEFCETRSIDAYLLVAPIYAKPGIIGQIEWFKTLMNAVNTPCMLYNVPSRSGVDITPAVLSYLAEHKNLWALKEASGSIDNFLQYRQSNHDIQIFSGEDGLMSHLTALGATGVVSVVANVWPEATNLYMQQCLQNTVTSHSVQLWQKASKLLFVTSNPIPAKAILAELEHIATPQLRAPLSTYDMQQLDKLIQVNTEIESWFQEQIGAIYAAS